MNGKRTKIPELLAPAGSEDALKAALAGGADAVYFGGSAFSNRMRAKNFTDDGLTEAIRRVHDAGAAAHITVNTRVRDREMDDALRLAERILGGKPDTRADAVIIADMGLAAEIRKRWPHAVFHASTQTSLGSAADISELKKLGFARLVLPRELNREEIAALCGGPLEIEIFIHGAHCVSLSGQCLMSFYCGGRSGNRGECAQPCRLPYRVSVAGAEAGQREKSLSGTPLSLADMCLAGRIADVCGLGVDSLKIEGRLKSAGYVYGVTSVYRRLLDERRNAEPGEIRELEALFSRGFTDGYYTGRYGSMNGGPAKDDQEKPSAGSASGQGSGHMAGQIEKNYARRIREKEEEREAGRTKRLTAECVIRRGMPASLTLRLAEDPSVFGAAEGAVPAEAVGKALDGEGAARNLTKLGGTGYALGAGDIRFDMDEGLWLPASALNDLRRRAAEELDSRSASREEHREEECETVSEKFVPYVFPARSGDPSGWSGTLPGREDMVLELADAALLEEDPSLTGEILSRFCRVYVPAEQYIPAKKRLRELMPEKEAPVLCAVMPAFPLPEAAGEALIRTLKEAGCGRIEAHGIGGAALAGDFTVDLSFRGNVTNGAAAAVYRDAGFSGIGLSPELPAGGIRALEKVCGGVSRVSCIAYGRVPVMTAARCVLKGKNRECRGCGGRREIRKTDFCRGTLTDRVGAEFPVFGAGDCVNVIYNAVPVWMGDRLEELRGAELWFMWTVESPAEMLDVLRRYERGGSGEGRRIP